MPCLKSSILVTNMVLIHLHHCNLILSLSFKLGPFSASLRNVCVHAIFFSFVCSCVICLNCKLLIITRLTNLIFYHVSIGHIIDLRWMSTWGIVWVATDHGNMSGIYFYISHRKVQSTSEWVSYSEGERTISKTCVDTL